MKAHLVLIPLILVLLYVPGRAQTARKKNPDGTEPSVIQHNSGPLSWIRSDVNPKTVFWIQGRFVPVDDASYQGNAEVATILCSAREYECLDIDSTSPLAHGEQVWIDDFKIVNWDKGGVLASARSLDGCTDETLRIRFSPPSVILINSPVLPMSESCKKYNDSIDKIMGKRGWTIVAQTEQDKLVPTRALFPWADEDIEIKKATVHVEQRKP